MKKQVCIKLTEAQYNHFLSLVEREGCKSVPEMLRKAAFIRWPMNKSKDIQISTAIPQISTAIPQISQEEKKEEREKSPHTPLKEKEARKEERPYELRACTRTREEEISKAKIDSSTIPSLSVDVRKHPTLPEAIAYARLRMSDIPVESICEWHNTMTTQCWHDRRGVQIRNWTYSLRKWGNNKDKHERGKRIVAALERDVDALEKRVELTEKANAAREAKRNAAASANNNSRYYNGRLKLSNHVDISEEERNEILEDFGF